MRSLLAPFVLRRLKSELAEQMVTKNHKLHEVGLMPHCSVHSMCCYLRSHTLLLHGW